MKTDPKGALQYGLIAEEVAKLYPELVIRNEEGRIDGVRYDELVPTLLNEVQQQAERIRDLKQHQKQFATETQQLRDMQQQFSEMEDVNRELHAALRKLQAKDQLVAQR